MKALVFHGKGDIRVQDVDAPSCGPGKVKVKPVWCGICGTDLHEYLGGPNMCPTTPHPITGEKIPVTFGHEFSAIVEEVGAGVDDITVGDRVCVEPIIWDGKCQPCLAGRHNSCDKGGFVGLSGWGGGFSEHCVVPASSIYRLPANVSMEAGALVEPLAVGWHAVKMSPVKPNDTVLILGGGAIGLCVTQALKARGVGKVIVSEMAQKRKELAVQFGADAIIDPSTEDVIESCKRFSEGRGIDVVFDCAGVQVAFTQGVQALREQGTIVNVAVWEKDAVINPMHFVMKERKYQGIVTYERGDFQEVLDAISSGKISPEAMITKKIKLNQIVGDGFLALINDKANQVKILVESV